jgi:hypothetical protein
VENMEGMLLGALGFKQDLCAWEQKTTTFLDFAAFMFDRTMCAFQVIPLNNGGNWCFECLSP